MQFKFKAELWLYPGDSAWVFVTLPTNIAKKIMHLASNLPKRGFGSIKVKATINNVVWQTSIFPDAKSNSYVIPIKRDVRNKANISVGDRCDFNILIEEIL